MKRRTLLLAIAVASATLVGRAHHSIAGVYDTSRQVTVEGVVSAFRFVNPHPFLLMDATDALQNTQSWRLGSTTAWCLPPSTSLPKPGNLTNSVTRHRRCQRHSGRSRAPLDRWRLRHQSAGDRRRRRLGIPLCQSPSLPVDGRHRCAAEHTVLAARGRQPLGACRHRRHGRNLETGGSDCRHWFPRTHPTAESLCPYAPASCGRVLVRAVRPQPADSSRAARTPPPRSRSGARPLPLDPQRRE